MKGIPMSRQVLARTLVFMGVLGLLFGVATSAANNLSWVLMSQVLGNAWLWIVLPYVAAWVGRSWRHCFVVSSGFIVPSVWGYYVADSVFGLYAAATGPDVLSVGIASDVMVGISYTVIGVAMCAVIAGVISLVRRGGLLGIVASGAVPAFIGYDALTGMQYLTSEAGHPVAWVVGICSLVWAAASIAVQFLEKSRNGQPASSAPHEHAHP